MSDYKFYYPDLKTEISKEEFLNFYNYSYYNNVLFVKEAEIEEILCSKSKKIEDDDTIIKILKWKTGGTYKDDGQIHLRYNKNICVKDVREKIKKYSLGEYSEENAKKFIEDIQKIPNIGLTYAITLLYFLTKGKQYPIYDKFAHIALTQIIAPKLNLITDYNFDKNIAIKNFEGYKEYFKLINKIFEKKCDYGNYCEFNYPRNIDRALWTYGHLFNDTKKNQSRFKEEK